MSKLNQECELAIEEMGKRIQEEAEMRPFQRRATYKDGYERGLAEGRAGAA